MKVLHVNHLLDPVTGGGTAERTFQLTRFLTSIGAECGILTLDIGDTRPYESLLTTERIYKLPCINQRYYIHVSWPFHIKNIVKQFDVVHIMGHWTLLNAIVAMVCRSLNKPYVVCPAGSLKVAGSSRVLKKLYDFLFGRRLVRKASAWIAVTEDEKSDFGVYGISADAVSVIPNGIDPSQYEMSEDGQEATRSALKRSVTDAPYILFLGRLNHIKGPDMLLEAFLSVADKYPAQHLIFAGPDAGMLDILSSIATRLEVADRIHFIGYVGGEDKVRLLRQATCLVIPSRKEAMSVVVLEAGICSTPVVFTDQCGLSDLAQANAGCMVKAEAADIARGLEQLLSGKVSRQQMAGQLHSIIRRDYLWVSQARKYRDVYVGLLYGH